MTRWVRTRLAIGALMSVASMAGCGGDIFAPPDDKVTVVNTTQDTVAFNILDVDYNALVDPRPGPPQRSDFDGRILAPRTKRRVPVAEIPGYKRNSDLVIVAWRVRGDSIRYVSTVFWNLKQQRKSAYSLTIEEPVTSY